MLLPKSVLEAEAEQQSEQVAHARGHIRVLFAPEPEFAEVVEEAEAGLCQASTRGFDCGCN